MLDAHVIRIDYNLGPGFEEGCTRQSQHQRGRTGGESRRGSTRGTGTGVWHAHRSGPGGHGYCRSYCTPRPPRPAPVILYAQRHAYPMVTTRARYLRWSLCGCKCVMLILLIRLSQQRHYYVYPHFRVDPWLRRWHPIYAVPTARQLAAPGAARIQSAWHSRTRTVLGSPN